jgi:hypothetical protein
LQNNTVTGTYYQSGNSTAPVNSILVNCQQVRYTTTDVYVNATEFQLIQLVFFTGDGNTNNAGNQNAIYKLPLTPTQKILERFRQLLLVTLEFLLMRRF